MSDYDKAFSFASQSVGHGVAPEPDGYDAIMKAITPESPSAPIVSAAGGSAPAPMSRMERFGRGLRDPIDGGAQLLTNMLPESVVGVGNKLNNWLADKTGLVATLPAGGVNEFQAQNNGEYESRRSAGGEAGFDGYRVIGNIANPVNYIPGAMLPKAATLAGRVAIGAGVGALTSGLAPVNEGEFGSEKLKQIGIGTIGGAAVPAAFAGLARVVSPVASTNAKNQLLKEVGVTPTIGQALGGRWNALEEKLTSVPIVGDMIGSARTRSMEQFNSAAINRAAGKVGTSIEGTGQSAVREAGDAIGRAYDDAIGQVKFLKFDSQFATDVGQLRGMAQGLTGPMRAKFNTKLDEVVGGRLSGTGSMLGTTYKKVDSEIGGLAAKYQKSAVASESELGDAFSQLQNLLKQQAIRSNPKAAEALAAADAGWANLVRVEGASKAAKNAEGIFTPAQLNAAIQGADGSVRGRAVARGTALMQDLGNAGQQVLGNKVPNSFTTDRALIAAGSLGGAFAFDPMIATGLLGAGALYTRPAQYLLSGAVTARPKLAQPIAESLRKASPSLGLLGGQVGAGLLNSQGQQ